jgi:hypothetical protein
MSEIIKYEYGAVSSRYSLEADNKLTAYSTIVVHYMNSPHLVVVYVPEDSDNWFSIDGNISERLDEIFGGVGSFEKYLAEHPEEIRACYETIRQLC